jgi:superfamily II DNA/RNA helicase
MIICTPGRLLDVLKKKIISLDKLKYLILDECDELLNKGFVDNIREISNYLNSNTRVALISATMNEDIMNLSNSLMIGDIFKYLVKNEAVNVREIK